MDDRTASFGYWLRRRRKALDLTQEELARSAACSRFTIRKIEADERRPSRRLAARLAETLAIPAREREAFLDAARALSAVHRLNMGASLTALDPGRREIAETDRFVCREAELALLTSAVVDLGARGGRVMLIEGEPGIGKSRLIRELVRVARARGVRTLATQCYQIERATPYQPVVDLLTQVLDLTPAASLQKLASISLAEIAALVPALEQRVHVPMLSNDFPEARQARLLRAVTELFDVCAAGGQLIVIVDDLQWADRASAQVVNYIARHAISRPLLVLTAYRDDELDGDRELGQLIASLRREPHAGHLPLARLPLDAAVQLLDGAGDAELAARLQHASDGNPFFLTAMLHALRAGEISADGTTELPVPEALRTSVQTRLAHVPAEARPVLDVAAVLGRRFDFDTLLAVTNGAEEGLLRALEMLVSRRLLREDADGYYDFSHDKIRQVAYLAIGAARRQRLHRAVAESIEQDGEAAPHERDALLAEHYERGRVFGKAVAHMALAAERSLKLFAVRDALHWLDRAIALTEAHDKVLAEPVLVDLRERRGRARALAGHTEGAAADIRVVIDAAVRREDRAKARDALIQLGMVYRRGDDHRQAIACLTQALAECRALDVEHDTANTLYHLGTVMWSDGRNREAATLHDEAVAICERLSLRDLVAVQAYHGSGEAHFNRLAPTAAIACFQRSIELAREIGDKSYESENLMMIGFSCTGVFGAGDYEQAAMSFEAALEIARRADLQWHVGPSQLGLSHVHACMGRYGEAWTGMTQMLHRLDQLGQTRYRLIAYGLLGILLLDLGLHAQAVAYSERALELADAARIRFWRFLLEANRAIGHLRLGRLDDAPELEEALAWARDNDERIEMSRCLIALAELAFRRGDPDRCFGFASELLVLAHAHGLKELAAQGRYWRGTAHAAAADRDEAIAELSAAAADAETIGRVCLARDAWSALGRISAGQAALERAAAVDAKIRHSAAGSTLANLLSES